jgi:hypothetical protein
MYELVKLQYQHQVESSGTRESPAQDGPFFSQPRVLGTMSTTQRQVI